MFCWLNYLSRPSSSTTFILVRKCHLSAIPMGGLGQEGAPLPLVSYDRSWIPDFHGAAHRGDELTASWCARASGVAIQPEWRRFPRSQQTARFG